MLERRSNSRRRNMPATPQADTTADSGPDTEADTEADSATGRHTATGPHTIDTQGGGNSSSPPSGATRAAHYQPGATLLH